ncbi:NAD(P)-binding protein [Cutaneotrichosporon oleaginosum]|uniref:NAD(P)-binding protein n=1 Tax=Cutaneotrichosporon oleaginosum TaxID=879819 RepID=A0A0J0XLD9_9TREE|nr:NAD(P)-binding protein [Cutaneotrichosporon oleaginosum]KLT41901.1 NAD(P)-binding protein [Cutaneotrichosporon oleaginosum]TXT12501.1 hypothetical protein COLE_02911 [Cutaneotrichosporon oleaginosum]
MSKPLGVALVGIGEVALTVHLPTLLLSPYFNTLALVDVSPEALAHAAQKFHVQRTYTAIEPVLTDNDIDLIMITSANEYHVEQAIAALRAGKHVFVEKPLALTASGAEQVAAVAKDSGKVCFVGFMRRYAKAFLRVKEMVHSAERIAYVRVRDIIGKNQYFVEQSGFYPRKFNDTPKVAIDDRAARNAAMLAEALGEHSARDAETWGLLTSLAVHDISAMRELIGMPRRVVSASRSADCQWIWATFEYDGFVAYYEVGIDDVRVFDAHIEAYLHDRRAKVTYDTPYVKGLPITATVQYTRNGDHVEETIRPTYEDAFTLEYKALYDAITTGKHVKTNPEDACEDLVIFKMVMDAIWAGENASRTCGSS